MLSFLVFVVKDFERDLLAGESGRRKGHDAMTSAMPKSVVLT